MNPYFKFGNSNSVTKKIKRNLAALLLLCGLAASQTINTNLLPATGGLNLGSANQRWNVWAANLNIVGTCKLNGGSCLGGAGGNIFNGIGFGSSFQDVLFIAKPSNPAAGLCRLYLDNTTFQFSGITSAGTSCMPAGGGGGGSGTVTAVNSGTGLTGGPISVSGTLSILAAYQLPQTCSNTQLPQWNSGSSTWGCVNLPASGITGATTGFGLISVSGSPTLGFTLAGTNGGIPYFSSNSTWASSSALNQYGVVYGGGAGAAPSSTAADTNTAHALFATATSPAFRAILSTDIPTLNQNTTGTSANVTGTVAVGHGGIGNTSTALYNVPVGLSSSSYNTAFTVPDCNGSSNALNFTQANLPSTDPWTCLSISTLSNPMSTLGDIIYGGASGAVTRLAAPTAPATPFVLTSLPSGGLGTAPFWNISGVNGRIVTGSSDTILGSDRSTKVWYCNNGGSAGPPCATSTAVAVGLPQAGTGSGTSSDFTKNFDFSFVAGPGLVTVTPTTSTINGNATLVAQNQSCFIHSTDNANYLAACFSNNSQLPIQTDTGAANAYVVTCPGVASPLQAGDSCLVTIAHTNTSASTINVSGLGIKNLMLPSAIALTSGAVKANGVYPIAYDGTEWVLLANSLTQALPSAAAEGDLPAATGAGTTYAAQGKAMADIRDDPTVPPSSSGDFCAALNDMIAIAVSNNTSVEARNAGAFVTSNKVYCNSNPFVGIVNIPTIYFGTYTIVTSVPWITTAQPLDIEGDVSSITNGTVLSACNATAGHCGPGSFPIFPGTAVPGVPLGGPFTPTRYTAGTITTTGTTAVTGSGTTFTSAMNGGFLCVKTGGVCTKSGAWGVIKSVNSTTSLTLEAATLGTVSGVSYTIQEPNAIPLVWDGGLATGATDGTQGNCFGHKWNNITIDTNGIATAIGIYSTNCEERSDYNTVKVVHQSTTSGQNSATPYACYAFDRSFVYNTPAAAHWRVTNGQCDNGVATTTSNSYGVIVEYGITDGTGSLIANSMTDGNNGAGDFGTIVGHSGNTLQAAIWLDGLENFNVKGVHCEWDVTCVSVGANNPTSVHVEDLHCANMTGNKCVWLQSNSLSNIADQIESQTAMTLLQDDATGGLTINSVNCASGGGFNTSCVLPHYSQPNGAASVFGSITGTGGTADLSGETLIRLGNENILPNLGNLANTATTAAGTYTSGNLACVTATNTVGDCTSAANNTYFIGVNVAKDGSLPVWATAGTVTVNAHASGTWTAGDVVCTDASNAAVAADVGAATNCPGAQRQVGIVKTTSTATSHLVTLIFSGASSAGGGSGTVNSGTASHLSYYASSTNAVSDLGADLTFAVHTFSAASTLIFDISAATGTAAFKVPSNSSNTATAAASIDFDTTAGLYHGYFNGADHTFLYTAGPLGTPASGVITNLTGTCGSCIASNVPAGTTFTTPNIGAATGTSLLATGIVDGTAPITITTGTTANLGTTYKSGYTFNQEATAGTGVTYTLPATATGLQYCVRNSIVSGTGAADTGVLTVYPASSSYVILNGVRNTIGGGGTHGVASGGAAGDSACFVAIDATDWEVFVIRGTWTAN